MHDKGLAMSNLGCGFVSKEGVKKFYFLEKWI